MLTNLDGWMVTGGQGEGTNNDKLNLRLHFCSNSSCRFNVDFVYFSDVFKRNAQSVLQQPFHAATARPSQLGHLVTDMVDAKRRHEFGRQRHDVRTVARAYHTA